jgi:hypothetical protein
LEADFYHQWTPNPTNGGVKWSQNFVTYGMNLDYPAARPRLRTGQPAAYRDGGLGAAVGLAAAIEAPADTVLLAETKPMVILSGDAAGAFYPSNIVNSPAAAGPTTHACGLDGWGFNSAFEDGVDGIGGPIGGPQDLHRSVRPAPHGRRQRRLLRSDTSSG